ncbi:MFS transporter [Fodinicola feengrottensis]|uniref:MFS transporter n=1 Tax=Fodinicola feengrottensis TaxID=435914 RepID=A0ABN2GF32_9ACTN
MTSTPTRVPRQRRTRLHPAWFVAAVAFLAVIGAAGFRSTPGVMLTPLHQEFGWSVGTISAAVSVNLVLYGLTSPFATALMERFGPRKVVAAALATVAVGSGATVFMTAPWQLILCWGVLVGLGTGSMALGFAALVTDRWFVARRGLIIGILTAAGATGQLVFLPLLSTLISTSGWRSAALVVAAIALLAAPLVWWRLRDRPEDIGVLPYGATEAPAKVAQVVGGGAMRAVTALGRAARKPVFWLLAASFAICGATTNGLVQIHFIPAAHDHGMVETTSAGLLAMVGVFDIVGTVLSGWLTDRFDSRLLLIVYYTGRGLSLLVLPSLFAATLRPDMVIFIVFYGLDWVATVPPTVALCRRFFGADGPVVFAWVLASHQVGAGIASVTAGVVRDALGNYDLVWYVAGMLSVLAAIIVLAIQRRPRTVVVAA